MSPLSLVTLGVLLRMFRLKYLYNRLSFFFSFFHFHCIFLAYTLAIFPSRERDLLLCNIYDYHDYTLLGGCLRFLIYTLAFLWIFGGLRAEMGHRLLFYESFLFLFSSFYISYSHEYTITVILELRMQGMGPKVQLQFSKKPCVNLATWRDIPRSIFVFAACLLSLQL